MIHDTLDKDFTLWLAAKAKQGLLMPCHDEEAPMLTRLEALTLSVLGDAIEDLQDVLARRMA